MTLTALGPIWGLAPTKSKNRRSGFCKRSERNWNCPVASIAMRVESGDDQKRTAVTLGFSEPSEACPQQGAKPQTSTATGVKGHARRGGAPRAFAKAARQYRRGR